MKIKNQRKKIAALAERIFDIGQAACAKRFHITKVYKWAEANPQNKVGCRALARALVRGEL